MIYQTDVLVDLLELVHASHNRKTEDRNPKKVS